MALLGATNFPGRCLAVITESAQAFVEERTLQGISSAQINFEDAKNFEKLKKYHGDKTQWVLDAWIKVWLSPAFRSWTLEKDLPKVKCPVLIIHGDIDEYGSDNFPRMIRNFSGGKTEEHILSRCSHVPHREKPDQFLDLVEKFLS